MPTLVSTGQFTIVDVNDSPITNLTPPSELTSVVASPMGGWTLYSGTVSNSSIVNDQVGPNGEYPRILRTAGDGVSIAGWYSIWRYYFKVDITKAYVHYCWIRRRSATSANLYLGWTNAANSIDNLAGVNDSNPYFISAHNPTIADKWYLCVGVIWPAGYGGGDTGLAGMYDPHTGVRVYDGAEWRHNVAATQQYIRLGFYNNTTAQATTDGYDFLPVGTYCMDGTHPTKEAIMNTVPAAMTAALSKETFVFPAANTGDVSSYSGSGTQIRVYQGTAELTYDGVGTAKGTWRISSTTPTNITVGSITDSGTFATVADHSGVAAGTDTSTIVYNIAGKTLTGADFTLVKTQTFAKAKAGTNGTNGVRTAVLEMYQWAASAPSSFPSGSSTYTWSNGTFTAPATTNGWTLTPGTPSAGQTLYVVRQVFTDSLTSATSSVTWSASSSLPSGAAGTNGTNGQRVGVLEVYQWAVSAPTLYPTGTSTYTWSNGSFTAPSTPNGWSLTPGSPAVGQTLWAISTRVSDNLTSSTSTATWSSTSPYAVGYAGTNGTNGIAGERGSKEFFATGSAWSDATADSAITVAGLTKVLLDQVTISNGTNFAESRFWNGTAWTAISQVINGNLLVNGTVGANALVAGTILANVFNVGDTKFKLDGAAKGAGKGALIVTNGTNDILTLGYLDGTNIGLSLKDASGNVVMQTSTPAGGGATANSFSPSISNNAITVDVNGILQGTGTANTVVANSQIAVNASGQVTGIGTGNNTTVANSQIAVNASGQVTGIGTGNNTTVANSQIAVNASGQVTGIGTGNNTTVANSQITISSGTINGIGTGNGTAVANDSVRGGGVNLVGNSGFLKNNGTLPTNWGIYNNGAISVTSTVQSGGLFGQNYIRITSNASTTASLGIYVSNNADSVKSWEPGQLYCISFWAKGSGGMLGQTMYGFYSNMGFTGGVILENPVVTGSWQRYVFRGTPNNNATTPNGELFISWLVSGTLASGSVLDITCPKVELGSQPTSWTPSPQDTLNQNISISSGAIQGIGSGTGTMVSNNAITVDANGILQGTGTANTVVANDKVTISNGAINGIGTGSGTTVANNAITVDANGVLQGTGTSNIVVNNSFLETQTFITNGTVVIGNTIKKNNGSGGWDAHAYSKEGYINGAFASFSPDQNFYCMAGLNSDPATNTSYDSLDYAFYMNGTDLRVYESGVDRGSVGSYAVGDILSVTYDGSRVNYIKNGSVLRTVTVTISSPLYFDCSFATNAASISKVKFGPMSSNNWDQITNQPAGIYNSNISISNGAINGIGTGSGTTVANSSISISNGQLQGIGTGDGTAVANSQISISSNGTLNNAGGGQVTLSGVGFTGDTDAQRNSRITVSSGQLSGIGTAGVYVDNTYTSTPNNLIPNSDQTSSITMVEGWNPNGATFDATLQYASNVGSGWVGSYILSGVTTRNLYVHQNNITAGGDNAVALDIYPTGGWDTARIPVQANEKYIFSCYLQGHRCKGAVGIGWWDAAGNQISSVESGPQTLPHGQAAALSQYSRVYTIGTAPSNAASATLFIRKYNTIAGNTESYFWLAAPMFERVNSNTATPGPYVPGPALSTRQLGYSGELNATYGAVAGTNLRRSNNAILNDGDVITSQGTAAAISGQGALATRNNTRLGNEVVDESGNAIAAEFIRNNVNRGSVGTVAYPSGGSFAADVNGLTGAFQIVLPNTIGEGRYTMLKFQVDIYNYTTDATITYDISGYTYPANPSWINCTAKVVGGGVGSVKPVRFGRTGSGASDKFCVWIGDTSTVWYYPKVQVRNLLTGYSSIDVALWQSGWAISSVTTLGPVDFSVLNPTAGDTIFGLNALETWDGTVATLPNFKTSQGTAAAIANQAATATSSDFSVITGATKPANNANNTFVDGNGQIQGVSSGTGTMVSNNAITVDVNGILQGTGTANTVVANDKVTISNGTISGIGTGNGTAVDNQYTIIGQNLLPNSDCARSHSWQIQYNPNGANITEGPSFAEGANGWDTTNYVLAGTETNNLYVKQDGIATGTADGSGNNAVACDIYPYENGTLISIPAIAGEVFMASAYIGNHRCVGSVFLGFFSSSGTALQYYESASVGPTGANTNILSLYNRAYIKGTAPANTAYVRLFVRKRNTLAGNTTSFMWWAAPQLERVNSGVSLPSPYQPGPPSSTRQLGYSGELNATYGAVAGTNLRDSVGSTLSDSAIKNASITIDGSGILQNIGTGSIVVANSQVPVGQNLCINSDFINDMTGWAAGWNGDIGGTILRGINNPGWFGQINVLYAVRVGAGAPAAGTVFDAFVNETTTSGVEGFKRYGIPVIPGERVYFSWLVAGHRCHTRSVIGWYDSTGTYFTENAGTYITENGGAAGGDPTTMARSEGFATVPANARYARIWVRGIATGATEPYIFCAQPFVTKVPANQTAVPPYSSGPADRAATYGAVAGTNLRDSGGTTLTDSAIKNAVITISNNGALSGAGGGQVTIGGLGYTGALNATNGATIGTNLSGQFNSGNVGTFFANATIGNNLIVDGAISASKIVVQNRNDICPDSGFRDFSWWNLNSLTNLMAVNGSNASQPARFLRATGAASADRTSTNIEVEAGAYYRTRLRIYISPDAAGWWGCSQHWPNQAWRTVHPTTTRADVDSNGYPVIDMANTTIPKGSWLTYVGTHEFIANSQGQFIQHRTRYNLTAGYVEWYWEIVRAGSSDLIVDGSVTAAKVNVGQLSAISANLGTITAGYMQSPSGQTKIDLNNARIEFNNGVYMKVSGVGFGSSNQFLEWYGPSQASLANCTEANAVYYLKTSGQAYFGGTLSAGIIKNSAQTTSIVSDASIVVGPFSTNGNTKTIVVSYGYSYSYSCNTNTGSITGATGAATVIIEKSTNGGSSWTQIGTLNAVQTQRDVLVDGEPGVPDQVAFAIGGSTTVTDNTGATSNLQLRARLTSRTLASFGGTGITGAQTLQNISVISTE